MEFKAHPYQERAIEFTMDTKSVFEMIDLGLGKTMVALKCIEKAKKTAIVVAPLEVCYQVWPSEIKIWTPNLSYTILHGPNKNKNIKLKRSIYIINYEGLKWFYTTLQKGNTSVRDLFMVFDESSWCKDPSTKRFKMLKNMRVLFGNYILNLSASPASKGLHNLWSQFYLLDGGRRLGRTYYSFRDKYFNYTGHPVYRTTPLPGADKKIYDKITDITFRLDGADYLDLPKIVHNNITLDLPKKLRKMYNQFEQDFFLEVGGASIEAWNSAIVDNKLKQFLQGAMYESPGKYVEIHTLKIDMLKYVLETMNENPLLVPIQYRFEYEMICRALKKQVPVVSGITPRNQRGAIYKAWNAGELPLLLCHPRSLAYGLNLQESGNNILWHSLTWSRDYYDQLNGRLARQGQKAKIVVVNHTVFRDTVDETVMNVLQSNAKVQNALLDALKQRARRVLC